MHFYEPHSETYNWVFSGEC